MKLSNLLLHRLGRIAILFLILLLLAQGASATTWGINNTSLFIQKNGQDKFFFAMFSSCDPNTDYSSYNNSENCLQSAVNLSGIDYGISTNNYWNASDSYYMNYWNDTTAAFNTTGIAWDTNWDHSDSSTFLASVFNNSPDMFGFYVNYETDTAHAAQVHHYNDHAKVTFPTKLTASANFNNATGMAEVSDVLLISAFYRQTDDIHYNSSEMFYVIEDKLWWHVIKSGCTGSCTSLNSFPGKALVMDYLIGATDACYEGPSTHWALSTKQQIRAEYYYAVTVDAKGVAHWNYKQTDFDSPDDAPKKCALINNLSLRDDFYEVRQEFINMNNILVTPSVNYSWGGTVSGTPWGVNDNRVTFSPNPVYNISDPSYFGYKNHKTFSYALKQIGTKYYLFVVNKNSTTYNNVVVTISGLSGSMNATILGNSTLSYDAAGRTVNVVNGVFTDNFQGFAGRVYEISNATTGGESSNSWTISGSGGNATWSENSTADNTVVRGNQLVTIDLSVQNYTSWWDGLTNNTVSTSVWDVNRTTANTGTLSSTSLWTNPGWTIDANNENMTASSSGVNRSSGSVFMKFKSTSGVSEYARLYSTGSTLFLARYASSTNILHRINGVDDIFTIPTLWGGSVHTIYSSWNDSSNRKNMSIDAGTILSNTTAFSMPANHGTLHFGNRAQGDYPIGGIIEYVILYPNELSSSQISQLNSTKYLVGGNVTIWHNQSSGNVTNQIVVNATTPANTNYSVYYRLNNTGDFISLASNRTGNQTISITTKYQNTDVRLQLSGNETSTPEVIQVTYYSQAAEEESTSTVWTTGIGGQFFQNRTIGSNRTCINQGDGSIGIGYLCDNFNDNNTVGWNETGNLNGTWTIHNGILNQSGAFTSYQYWNVTSYENMSIFSKFKEHSNLSSFIDAADLRGNLSRVNANPSWLNVQFSIGSSTQTRAHIYAYNGSSWLTVNNTATKTRYLNEWNYASFFANGTYYRGYLSNVSYTDALATLLASGTSGQWLNGTTIQFGGQPNSATTISWDEIRVVELDAQGNQYLQGNYSMNYTVPASQYAKNITVNATYTAGTNYSLKYRQNATGNYVSVGGVKTADATIELPTPYYQSIDIMLEMNASTSDTLWIDTIIVGTSENNGGISLYNTGYQYVIANNTLTNIQLNNIWSPTWIIGWNSTSQKWENYKSGWNIRASRITNKGDAIGIKVTTNKSITLTYNTTYNWTLVPGQNLVGLEVTKTLSQINTSVNTACEVNLIEYIKLETQTSYLYTCGQAGNASIQVSAGEGVWMNTTANKNIVRTW